MMSNHLTKCLLSSCDAQNIGKTEKLTSLQGLMEEDITIFSSTYTHNNAILLMLNSNGYQQESYVK